jgi:hypothetical protein
MGLLDDLLYNASPDNGPGLLGYLTSGRTAHVSDEAKNVPAPAAIGNAIDQAAAADPLGSPGAPSVPISTSNFTPSPAAPAASPAFNSPITPPSFGVGGSPYLFPQSGALFGGIPPAPAASPANANAQDDEEEDAPTAPAQASPIRVGDVQMPRIGPASAFTPSAAPAAPVAAPAAPVSPFAPVQNFLNRGADALQSISRGGSLTGAIRGQFDDPKSLQTAQSNLTARALLAKGVDPQVIEAAIQPGNGEMLKALVTHAFGPQTKTSIGEGYVVDKDGNVTRAYTPEQKDNFELKTVKDALGNESLVKMNKADGTVTPAQGGNNSANGGPAFGSLLAQGVTYDPNKTGDDYMSQFSPEVKAAARAYMNGDVMPTGNSRNQSITTFAKTVAQKYGQDMGIQVNDSTYSGKRKLQTDLASSSNSSMGGILSNGESSFSHLAEATSSMADLKNASHNFPGGGIAAHVQNYVGNSLGGSDTQAKILATVDNLGKYGAEATKFYAGTGGGVEERTAARKDVDPNKVSGEEMAAFAEKEKGLMLDRLNTKFQQIRDTFGEEEGNAIIAKHMPQIQKNIATIDANVARMRGEAPTATSTPTIRNGVTATNPKTGQKITFMNGKWQ